MDGHGANSIEFPHRVVGAHASFLSGSQPKPGTGRPIDGGPMNTIKLIANLAVAAAAVALAACQALDAPKTARLKGSVDAGRTVTGPFVITAYDRATNRIAHRVYLEQAGDFDMLID